MTDPIADMLSRIRNAIYVRKHTVALPHSKVKESLARLLAENNFINSVSVNELDGRKYLTLVINSENQNARITEIERISKPGRRIYKNADKIPVVKRGRGLVIISTSKGMMTGQNAQNHSLGGELICQVY